VPRGRSLTRTSPAAAASQDLLHLFRIRPPSRTFSSSAVLPIGSIPRGGRRRLWPVPGRRKPWIRPCAAFATSSDHQSGQVDVLSFFFGSAGEAGGFLCDLYTLPVPICWMEFREDSTRLDMLLSRHWLKYTWCIVLGLETLRFISTTVDSSHIHYQQKFQLTN